MRAGILSVRKKFLPMTYLLQNGEYEPSLYTNGPCFSSQVTYIDGIV